MGTVMFIDIPSNRQDLREKFHPDNFPVWRFLEGSGEKYAIVFRNFGL
jgi:sarcosine oxidase/L-pipecolate oxidase